MLPNLIVIGAGKAGTTSLHFYLDQHPEIYMSRIKEPFFFQRDDWRQRLEWYESLFPEPAPVRGESSTSYTAFPVKEHVPCRIHEVVPEAKLIYLVRDPVDRVVAHYSQHRAIGKETRSLEEAMLDALRDSDDPINPYLCMSRYATQIEQYLEYFPAGRMLVIDHVDMQQDRRSVLREAFRFLDVDTTFTSPRFDQVLNTQRDQIRFNRVGAMLRDTRLAQLVKSRLPRGVGGAVTKPFARLLSQPLDRPTLPPQLRADLAETLEPEVERLRELTGKPFSAWSV